MTTEQMTVVNELKTNIDPMGYFELTNAGNVRYSLMHKDEYGIYETYRGIIYPSGKRSENEGWTV